MKNIFVVKEVDGKLEIVEWKKKNPPLMLCGHSAQAIWHPKEFDKDIWTCVICDGKESRVIAEQVDLKERTAKCTYFGKPKPNRRYANDECNYGCRGNLICQCGSIPSNFNLAFFKHWPDGTQDEFYCGCHGWD